MEKIYKINVEIIAYQITHMNGLITNIPNK